MHFKQRGMEKMDQPDITRESFAALLHAKVRIPVLQMMHFAAFSDII